MKSKFAPDGWVVQELSDTRKKWVTLWDTASSNRSTCIENYIMQYMVYPPYTWERLRKDGDARCVRCAIVEDKPKKKVTS